jgi:putative heme iron utilization protein
MGSDAGQGYLARHENGRYWVDFTDMNADHVDSMILLARSYAQMEAAEAIMTSVDRLGFTLRLKTKEGVKGARINFLREVATAQATRKVLIEMVEQTRR